MSVSFIDSFRSEAMNLLEDGLPRRVGVGEEEEREEEEEED